MTRVPNAPTRSSAHRRLLWAFSACQLVSVALLLVVLVASLLLSGAQVLPDGQPRYDAAIPFPVFEVPAWLSVVLGVAALVLVVPLVVTTTLAEGAGLIQATAYSVGAAVADFYFAFAFPTAGGPGLHWVAAAAAALCVVILLVRAVPLALRFDRLRAAGLATEVWVSMRETQPASFEIQVPAGWLRSAAAGERDAWQYAPAASAAANGLPTMRLIAAPGRASRGRSFVDEFAPQPADVAAGTENLTTSAVFAVPDDARRGIRFTATIAGGDRASREACRELAQQMMDSFRWT